jgi:DDE superfamily endonuclease
VLLDGTLIPTRRRTGTASRRNYNGKHNKHGRLFLALTDESGNLIWISSARRGAAGEITAARHDHLAARLRTAGPGALADPGFTGLDPAPKTPSSSPAGNPPRPAIPPPPSGTPTRPCPPPAPPPGTASATLRTGGSSPASASTPARRRSCCAPCSS